MRKTLFVFIYSVGIWLRLTRMVCARLLQCSIAKKDIHDENEAQFASNLVSPHPRQTRFPRIELLN